MISARHIAKALIKIEKEKGPEKTVQEFMAFVEKYSLDSLVPSIMKALKIESDKAKAENTFRVEVSHPVSADIIERIRNYIEAGKDAFPKITEKPELLGGFRAYWKDKKVDASIERALRRLHRSLINN